MRIVKQVGSVLFDVPATAHAELVFGAAMGGSRATEIAENVTSFGINVEFTRMEYARDGYGVIPKPFTH